MCVQGLAASLSTFSGHLRRISAARMESDSHSLVLLDELGTGTDPAEGSALAAALLSRLVPPPPPAADAPAAGTRDFFSLHETCNKSLMGLLSTSLACV